MASLLAALKEAEERVTVGSLMDIKGAFDYVRRVQLVQYLDET